jgi:hypothetical protein
MLSFSGQISETITLHKDPALLERNCAALASLIDGLGPGETNPQRERDGSIQQWRGVVWHSVPASQVTAFLAAYRTHPDAYKVNNALLSEFITKMNAYGELTEFTVALIGARGGAVYDVTKTVSIEMLKRSAKGAPDRYSIGRLLSPRDETIDLTNEEYSEALRLTQLGWKPDPARSKSEAPPTDPSGPSIRAVRGQKRPECGLLLLYVLDPKEAGSGDELPPVVAMGLSFPASNSGTKVEYRVTNILWTQEYGGAD